MPIETAKVSDLRVLGDDLSPEIHDAIHNFKLRVSAKRKTDLTKSQAVAEALRRYFKIKKQAA
jgi:hypothetical protein